MASDTIESLLAEIRRLHGMAAVSLLGAHDEEHGTYFKLTGIPATFSVHTREGTLPAGYFDIQIEGVPPGDYLYTDVVSGATLLELVNRLRGPESQWPGR